MVVHDLNHASRYADHIVALADGQVVATGAPRDEVTPQMLRRVCGVEADIVLDPRRGVPLCIPYDLCEHVEPSLKLQKWEVGQGADYARV